MSVEITKTGTTMLERTGEDVVTDVYKIRFTRQDAPKNKTVEERKANGRTIGCSNCKTNTFAFFEDSNYVCSVCLTSNNLSKSDIKNGFMKTSIR